MLWAVGVAATAGLLGVFSTEVLDRYDEHALVIIGPCTAVVAGILWWLRSTWLQQLALFVPLMLSARATQALGSPLARDVGFPYVPKHPSA